MFSTLVLKAMALLSSMLTKCFCGCCIDLANVSGETLIYLDQIEPTIFTSYDDIYQTSDLENDSSDYISIYKYVFSQSNSSTNS